jgi:NADH-quinone oxidoreductase subunit C
LDAATIISVLTAAVPGGEIEAAAAVDQPTIIVPRERFPEVCRVLRDTPALRFDALVDVTAVDFWPAEPRFEVVYHLVSTALEHRLRLKVRLPGGDPHVATLHRVWASACWLEREVWDLFGIVFDGHGDLRRLLMPEDWEGHPLRKDYPVQVKVPYRSTEAVQLTEQEFLVNIERQRRATQAPRER